MHDDDCAHDDDRVHDCDGVHDGDGVHDEDDHVAYSCGHLIPFFHSDAHAFLL